MSSLLVIPLLAWTSWFDGSAYAYVVVIHSAKHAEGIVSSKEGLQSGRRKKQTQACHKTSRVLQFGDLRS